MKSATRVAAPPSKPLLVYDGDCTFCTLWAHRWHAATGEAVDYLPSQDPEMARRFPEIPPEQWDSAVQLIEPDGSVFSAAEAVFRALAHNSRHRWALSWYEDSPAFARTCEAAYHFVSVRRPFFSKLLRLLWGRRIERPSYLLVRRSFLSCLGIIYFIAFVSLWTQVIGLLGSNGIAPVKRAMDSAGNQASAANIGLGRYFAVPTLCWISASDDSLELQCAAGAILSIVLVLGIAPAPCLFLLWLIYLSLCTVGEPFLNFQWDALLLETGFLSIFFAPLRWYPDWLARRIGRLRRPPASVGPVGAFEPAAPEKSPATRMAPGLSDAAFVACGSVPGPQPSRVVLWLLRLLLFKLMFQSGCVKLLSGDPAWHQMTALNFHFETQPLPTWIGWWAHQLPAWVHKSDTEVMFGIELGMPFLIFVPRRPRQLACLAFLALQLFILITGNYCFFNLLTMVLCLPLLDDAALLKCVPQKWRGAPSVQSQRSPQRHFRWPGPVTIPLAVIVVMATLIQFFGMFGVRVPWPGPIAMAYRDLMPLRSFNSYGLFAMMTTNRPEIMVEGSNDGEHWREYEFKFKPCDLNRRPAFVAPHQPRLDWQMWFAALEDVRQNPWLINFCVRLLQGSPDVLALMAKNPFRGKPPKYIRAMVYEYHFTDLAERRKTGNWWRREPLGMYMPPISLRARPAPDETAAVR